VPDEGYVIVERGVEADVTAIACPVYSEARIVAALSLVIPSYRLDSSQSAQYGRMLGAAAASLSAGLSRRPNFTAPEGHS
jgi:DNA-binding IclR family transcriptional regulator